MMEDLLQCEDELERLYSQTSFGPLSKRDTTRIKELEAKKFHFLLVKEKLGGRSEGLFGWRKGI